MVRTRIEADALPFLAWTAEIRKVGQMQNGLDTLKLEAGQEVVHAQVLHDKSAQLTQACQALAKSFHSPVVADPAACCGSPGTSGLLMASHLMLDTQVLEPGRNGSASTSRSSSQNKCRAHTSALNPSLLAGHFCRREAAPLLPDVRFCLGLQHLPPKAMLQSSASKRIKSFAKKLKRLFC